MTVLDNTMIGNNARLLSNDVLARWLIEDFPYRIQLSSALPFLPVAGDQLRYATTGPLRPGVTIGNGEVIAEDTKHPIDPNRAYSFAEIATQFRISYKAQDLFSSNANDQVAVQMALAGRELLYKFWTLFESGNAMPQDNGNRGDEFDGLLQLVAPVNVIDLAGEPLTLEALDAAKERIRSKDGRGSVIYTSSIGKRAIHAAYWTRGLNPDYTEIDSPCPDNEFGIERVLAFDGAPVYINDLNQVSLLKSGRADTIVAPEKVQELNGLTPALTTNIWFMTLGEGNLHGIMPAHAQSIIVRSTILADASTTVYHLTMPVGIALGSAGALSVLRNVAIPS